MIAKPLTENQLNDLIDKWFSFVSSVKVFPEHTASATIVSLPEDGDDGSHGNVVFWKKFDPVDEPRIIYYIDSPGKPTFINYIINFCLAYCF